MSTKKDPVIAVLQYFEEADLALAAQGLALAQQIVRRRRGPKATPATPAKAGKTHPRRAPRPPAPVPGEVSDR